MRRVLVVNGPNLNLLGTRRPDVYGTATLADLDAAVVAWGRDLDLDVSTYQSNHEGRLIDRLHAAVAEQEPPADGVVINPGALTHYSYALHDAVEAIGIPTVEVHISDVTSREEWRRHSVVKPACAHSIYGRGIDGYRWALRHLVNRAAMPFETVRYGPADDNVADLRVPDGAGPHPVAVIIHGGFWRTPWTRDATDAVAVDLTRRGWASWNIEYRRVGAGGGWPVTLQDVADAVEYLPEIAARGRLDLDRIVAVGHSAGGHLALWLGCRQRLPTGAPGSEGTVHPTGIVALAPVADLAEAHRLGLGDGAVEDFLRRSPTEGDDRYRVASPAEHVPFSVPHVLVHGDADDRVPLAMSRSFAADSGGELVSLAGADHFDVIEPGGRVWSAVIAAVDGVRGNPL